MTSISKTLALQTRWIAVACDGNFNGVDMPARV